MSSNNEENTTTPEADTELDTEGHRVRSSRIGEAGTDDDTEGHRVRSSRISEAGTDDDDTEGHGRRHAR